ncbi:MAG TPA: dihydrofolate reductase family protein [Solirubrobacter sp.]|jgi:2,5-diamino-6-(ribosylamino)-4(3H)-pyrimidinone 5'-phosphate reductase|nr:dihydrofolate reductase family protein [Solirubrobacter sp.]
MAHVVIHVAISLDGATTGFTPDVGTFYSLARGFNEDVTLCGADTILAQDLSNAPQPGPNPDGPELIVTDRRGRMDDATVEILRNAGYWRSVRRSRGELAPLLEDLGVVRVDSGGALNGALLAAGLVDEISLLVHPLLVGDAPRWYGASAPLALEMAAADTLDGGLVWLRYRASAE